MDRNRKSRLSLVLAAAAAVLMPSTVGNARMASSRSTGVGRRAEPPEALLDTPRHPVVVVRALGNVPQETLHSACRSLRRHYPVRCAVGSARPLDDSFAVWNADHDQIDARATLELLFRDRRDDSLVELNIVNVDMFEAQKPYVFGLASLTDRVAIISLARIDNDGDDRLARRLNKLVLHEVGHTLGQHHHNHHNCVMRQDPTVASLDTAPESLCPQCHAEAVERANKLGHPGQPSIDHLRGLLRRGDIQGGRKAVANTLHHGQFDIGLLRRLAAVFFEDHHYNEAISLLRYATKLAPDDPDTLADLAVCYQMRNEDGDHHLALTQLDRALELRPTWQEASEHRARLATAGPGGADSLAPAG